MAVVCSHCIAQTRRNAVMPPPSRQALSVNKWRRGLNFLFVLALFANTIGFANIIVLACKTIQRSFSEQTTEKHARPDYAAASWGATVVDHSEPLIVKGRWWSTSWDGVHHKANQMLSPSFGEPGRCFALKGSSGFVVVKLTELIVPDAITIEHVLGSVVDAPKDCRVTAWMQHGMYEPYRNEFVLGEFSYDVGKSNLRGKRNVRTFGVSKSVVAAGDEAVANMVKLEHLQQLF